jgi:hypothetical protein
MNHNPKSKSITTAMIMTAHHDKIDKHTTQLAAKTRGQGRLASMVPQFTGCLKSLFAASRNTFIACIVVLALGAFVTSAVADVTGDYRSAATGNWEATATWQTYNGSSWVAASAIPGSATNVFIQAGHVVTLTASEACNDLHISDGTTAAGTGGSGQVALGANTLSINGKVRSYFASVGGSGNLPGTNTTALPATPISMTAASAGEIKFVGNSRTIFNTGEWASGNAGSTTTYATEIALNSGQTATAQVNFKTSALTVSSGTLSMVGSSRIGIDNGSAGASGGNVTIANGAVLSSAISGSGAGSQVMSESTTLRANTLTIASGGKLQISGADPRMDMNTYVLNGTIEYTGGAAQNLLQKSNNDGLAADVSAYANLTVSGAGAKTMTVDTTVSGTLALTNGTLTVGSKTLTLNGPAITGTPNNLTTSPTSSLSFGGSSAGVFIPGSVTALNNLTINNASGVVLGGNLTVNNALTLTSGTFAVGANALVLNGPAIAGTPNNLTTTSGSTLVFGGTASGINIPTSVTALNSLIITNTSGVTLNAAPTLAGALVINSGSTLALNYSGTANITLLTFDSGTTWQTTGSYGFTGSGATTIDATHFATSAPLGTVTVSANAPVAAQSQNIYRSAASGNWSSASTWQTTIDGWIWLAATTKPVSTNNVFVQAGHVVTLTGSEACNDLNSSSGTTSGGNGGVGLIALGANTLSINGKLRCYFGTVSTAGSANLPGTSTTVFGSGTPISKTAASAGQISFVGNTRTILNVNEWSSGYTGSTTNFAMDIALNSGQVASAQTVFKVSGLTVTAGTLSTSQRIGLDNGTTGSGGASVTIASGAMLNSSMSGTNAGNQVMSQGTTTQAGALTINSGGTLQLSGSQPCMDMNAYTLNGTVAYVGTSPLTFVQPSGNASGAANISTYANLTLNGASTQTLATNTTVNGTNTLAGTGTLTLGGHTLTYGGASTLAYAGSVAQTTANTEFPASGGPNSVTINNTNGVTLNGSKTINGTLTVTTNTTLDLNSQTLTVGATALNGALTMEINKTGPNTFTGSELIQSSGTLNYGGTLNVTATGSTLAVNDAPVLFSGTIGGAFAVTNLPVLPSPGLYWDTSLFNTGVIKVAVNTPPTPTITSPAVSGTNFTLQVASSQSGFNYVLQATPTLAPVTWTDIQTNAGTGGTLNFTNPITQANPQQFFRINVQ